MNTFGMGPGTNFNIDTEEGMANAVEWTEKAFAVLADGGRWIVPRSMSIYEVNKTDKTVRRIRGMYPEPVIRRVLIAAGYTYFEETQA